MYLVTVVVLWLALKLTTLIYKPRTIYHKFFKKHKPIPAINDQILLESATNIAEKIRTKKVSKILQFSYTYCNEFIFN